MFAKEKVFKNVKKVSENEPTKRVFLESNRGQGNSDTKKRTAIATAGKNLADAVKTELI